MAGKTRIYLFDTTLRDGAQTQGVDFSLSDKQTIIKLLDQLGIDYIEAGYPGANPIDSDLFQKDLQADLALETAAITAFGMTKRVGRSVSNDAGFQTVLNAKAGAICLVAKASDYHVRVALGVTNEENLQTIDASVAAVKATGKEVMIDCEHFFDGYKTNPAYALDVVKTAYEAGARWVVLCDTNGGLLPHEVSPIIEQVSQIVPGSHLGIHTHNDTANAVANSLMAVRAGVRQIQGTLNGLGERCGNANLTAIIPTLLLKPEFAKDYLIGVSGVKLQQITHISRVLDEILNRAPDRHAPYVGEAAFAHKGGIHASAVNKDPSTYEHVDPSKVGNVRKMLISDQAGRSNILAGLKRVGIDAAPNADWVNLLLEDIKAREAIGYAYEGADASFELLARRHKGEVPRYFSVENFRVLVERRYNAMGELVTVADATVKVSVDGQTLINAAEGTGPIHALDQALRKDLGLYQKYIDDLELIDYKVRILTGGTDAVTRVLVESRDKNNHRWCTVGVSANIVDASFEALIDSINYKLMRDLAEKKLEASA